jgi:hypothetical protein
VYEGDITREAVLDLERHEAGGRAKLCHDAVLGRQEPRMVPVIIVPIHPQCRAGDGFERKVSQRAQGAAALRSNRDDAVRRSTRRIEIEVAVVDDDQNPVAVGLLEEALEGEVGPAGAVGDLPVTITA